MTVKTLKELAQKIEDRFKPKPKKRHEKRWAIEDINLAKQLEIKVSDLT